MTGELQWLAAVRFSACKKAPYLATAIFAMVPVATPGLATMAVDGSWRLYVDPGLAEVWSDEELAAVLVHEAHHLVRDHDDRARAAGVVAPTAGLWNLAADAAINDDLIASGFVLPGPVLPGHFGLAPHGVEEEYFNALMRRSDRIEACTATCGSGAGGALLDCEQGGTPAGVGPGAAAPGGIDEGGIDEGGIAPGGIDEGAAEAIRNRVAASVRADRSAPGGLARWAREEGKAAVDWRRELRRVLPRRGAGARSVPTFSRPSRRPPLPGGPLRPGTRRVGGPVAVVVDTSGSMGERELGHALREVKEILGASGPAPITVICADTEIRTVSTVRSERGARALCLQGGGGTDMAEAIAQAALLRPAPACVVVLTDGYTGWPARAPQRCSVVAVVVGDGPLPEVPGIKALRAQVAAREAPRRRLSFAGEPPAPERRRAKAWPVKTREVKTRGGTED